MPAVPQVTGVIKKLPRDREAGARAVCLSQQKDHCLSVPPACTPGPYMHATHAQLTKLNYHSPTSSWCITTSSCLCSHNLYVPPSPLIIRGIWMCIYQVLQIKFTPQRLINSSLSRFLVNIIRAILFFQARAPCYFIFHNNKTKGIWNYNWFLQNCIYHKIDADFL